MLVSVGKLLLVWIGEKKSCLVVLERKERRIREKMLETVREKFSNDILRSSN